MSSLGMNQSGIGSYIRIDVSIVWYLLIKYCSRLNDQHTYLNIVMSEYRLIFDKAIQIDKDSKVLDAGTGTGMSTRFEEDDAAPIDAIQVSGSWI